MQSPAWFKLLDKDLLKPPSDDSDWTVADPGKECQE